MPGAGSSDPPGSRYRKIDRLVYALYDLTDAEIARVEGKSQEE